MDGGIEGARKEQRKEKKENKERCQALVSVSVMMFSAMKGKRKREGLAVDFRHGCLLPCSVS